MLQGKTAAALFVIVFAIVTFIGMHINFSPLLGADNQFFTLFQFFGPITGALLGPGLGAAAVLLAELFSKIILGKAFDPITILRLFPMVLAAAFFGNFLKKHSWKDFSILVPLACMAAFMLHPIGATVWFYSLYWLIPIGTKLFSKGLFFRSLGATFTAHAVGTTLWLYTIPMTAEQWIALIPIVAVERGLFAIGISVSFLVFNTVFHRVESMLKTGVLKVDKTYLLTKA